MKAKEGWKGPTIREMRNRLKLTQTQFSERFNIPLRTLVSWEACEREVASSIDKRRVTSSRKAPIYVYGMLYEIVYGEPFKKKGRK